MKPVSIIQQRTASQTLIAAMESFQESEPKYFIAIWVDEQGDVVMCRTTKTDTTMQLGLIESAKMMIGAYLGAQIEDAQNADGDDDGK
jgi:hypothetical protein